LVVALWFAFLLDQSLVLFWPECIKEMSCTPKIRP
jgi:hypothetical protein